jgi:hypothetical protein
VDRLCGLVDRVPGHWTEMYCVSCEERTKCMYVCYVEEGRPLLWSIGQSSWLQIQRSGFDPRRYQIFWEVLGLERSPLSLLSTNEELIDRKRSDSGLESREYGREDTLRLPRNTLPPQKLELTSPTSGGCSVGIVRSRTQATEFIVYILRSFPNESEVQTGGSCELRSLRSFIYASNRSACS